MNVLARTILSGPGAFVVTTGLALIMAKMIYVPFVALPDKPEKMSFTVNPEITEIVPVKKRKAELVRVTPPPAPPVIERPTPTLPTGPIAEPLPKIPPSGKPTIHPANFRIAVADRDAEPFVRVPPIMPPRAEKSGHCKVKFNVTTQGQPYEIVTTYCTQSVFKRPTIKSVRKWKYNPKILNGIAVARQGVETRISFHLTDERGFLIPE